MLRETVKHVEHNNCNRGENTQEYECFFMEKYHIEEFPEEDTAHGKTAHGNYKHQ